MTPTAEPIRVLVTGASGQVGVDLVDLLGGRVPPGADPQWQPDDEPVRAGEFLVAAPPRALLDITRGDAVDAWLDDHRPDVVVNLAAYTAVDRAESDAAACALVNETATIALSQRCAGRGVHLVTISTDYVFDGEKGAPYAEGDAPNPLNVYGRTKRAGELGCAEADTIVRTSWVAGARGRNVVRVVAARARAGESVRFVTDQTGTLTVAADLARALVTLVRHRPGGVWHFANAGATTWFTVAAAVADQVGARADSVAPITTEQLDPTPLARRPRRSDLATERWTAAGYAAPPPWRAALTRLLAADR